MVSQKLAKKILNAYSDLRFPGSYQGISVFRKSLKQNRNIDITHQALQRLLKSSLHYQVNVTKAKRFKKRPFYSRGVGIEAFTDTVFVSLKTEGEKKARRFIFLVVVDCHSRMLYSTRIDGEVGPEALRQAYTRLFSQGMPKFPILRCDRDASLNKLALTYFASKNILLRARRSAHHMIFLEGIIRNLKRKFIQNLRNNEPRSGWTDKKLERALEDVTYSYNHTESSSHKITPISVNSPLFDPFLREALYGPRAKLQPFETFYKEQLKLRKKANTPDPEEDKPNFNEGKDNFKKGSLVYVDYADDSHIGGKYGVKRGPIYEICEVNTVQSPYLYKLRDPHSEKEAYGWYYGRELVRADLSADLEVEEVLKTKRLKNGNVLIYCKFKDHDSSFNRWIEKGQQ